MHPDTAKAALIFLSRTTLQGGEVPAFTAVVKALEALANPPELPTINDEVKID